VQDATLYCTHGPCLKCAQQILSAGITRIVYGVPYRLPDGLSLCVEQGLDVKRCTVDPIKFFDYYLNGADLK
jgi:dCMP deaminase